MGKIASAILILLLIIGIISAIYAWLSWDSCGVGEELLVINAQTHEISEPIIGPWAGFTVNGFARLIGMQYTVRVYYQMNSVSMWTEYREENGNYIESARGDYPAILTLSKDGLQIEVDLLVRWANDPLKMKQVYQHYPYGNWKEVTINSIIREKTRDVITNYNAIDVIEKRQEISIKLGESIKNALLAEPTLGFSFIPSTLEVDLRNIDPSVEFVHAIERKLAAEQAKIQAQYEYERTLTLAHAEADSKIIVANATQQAIQTIIGLTGETNSTRIAELYLTLEAYKAIAPNTKSFILITGQGVPVVYPLPTNSTAP